MYRSASLISALLLFAIIGGCKKAAPPEFEFDQVEWLKLEKMHLDDGEQFGGEEFGSNYQKEIPAIMESVFGTPEHAWFPFNAGGDDDTPIVEESSLLMAAGAVSSSEHGAQQGLYREHCAECHGVSGDGAGPTAGLLYPYPRDFRLGRFKFKSTGQRRPPTESDLKSTLTHGIPGTAMPSFKLLKEEELDALIDYVQYLSMRGQFEKYLINEVPVLDDYPFLENEQTKNWIDPVPRITTASLFMTSEEKEQNSIDRPARIANAIELTNELRGLMGDQFWEFVVQRWADDEKNVTPVPEVPAAIEAGHVDHAAMVAQGKELFLNKGGCVQCHGKDATGIGEVENNYDDWTNNWLSSPGVDPLDKSTFREFRDAGAMAPRIVSPRNLRLGIYRGGGKAEQLFRRIENGIEGTPMPAAAALNQDEIWALVAYVKSLHENVSGLEEQQ